LTPGTYSSYFCFSLSQKITNPRKIIYKINPLKTILLLYFLRILLVNQYTKSLISTPGFIHPPFDKIAHFELIKHFLKVLRLRKEEEIANYQPSDWEKLKPTEQFQLALFHSHQRAQKDTELLIKLSAINRRNQENKRRADLQRTLEYKQEFFNSQFNSSLALIKLLKSPKILILTPEYPLLSSTTTPSTSNSSTTAPATSVANSITPLTAPPTSKFINYAYLIFCGPFH
jgi:hypothetical protein